MKIPFKNTVDFRTKNKIFKNSDYNYTVSSRDIFNNADIIRYLQLTFIYIDLSQISSVFGSTTTTSDFYGGRVYNPAHSLTESQIDVLKSRKINLSLTLTNNFFSKELYINNLPFLNKYHQEGNSIICTSDELAKMIRKDFPNYSIKASIIKNINTLEKVKKAFELYDNVVIPNDMNDDDEFLENLPCKERISLFANAGCGYTCTSKICYAAISKINQHNAEAEVKCTSRKLGKEETDFYYFDVDKFHQMGFTHFKLIPVPLSYFSHQK